MVLRKIGKYIVQVNANGEPQTTETVTEDTTISLNLVPEDVADIVDFTFSNSFSSTRSLNVTESIPPNSGMYVSSIDYSVSAHAEGGANPRGVADFKLYASDGTKLIDKREENSDYGKAGVSGTKSIEQKIDRAEINAYCDGTIGEDQSASYNVTMTARNL